MTSRGCRCRIRALASVSGYSADFREHLGNVLDLLLSTLDSARMDTGGRREKLRVSLATLLIDIYELELFPSHLRWRGSEPRCVFHHLVLPSRIPSKYYIPLILRISFVSFIRLNEQRNDKSVAIPANFTDDGSMNRGREERRFLFLR